MRWILLIGLVACKVGVAVDDGNPDDTDDPNDTDTPTDTDDPPPTPVEMACDDEVDDDGDGLIDCDDPDCNVEIYCAWPSELAFVTQADFDASSLAETFGYNDCTIRTEATLVRDRASSCEGCDRVFCGAFSYPIDDCPEDEPRPAQGCFGLTFDDNDTAWPFQILNDQNGLWEPIGTATGDGGGTLTLTSSDPVEVDGFDAGTINSSVSFTRL